ncbi:tumor necrosis factor receptor superfamily member 9-like [Mustelus asterias]
MESRALLLALVMLVKLTAGANCPAGQYLNNKQCKPCPAGSYTESPNRGSRCKMCQPCQGGKFLILEACTGTSNTKCRCVEGFRCTTKECRSCQAHTVCAQGQDIQEKGNSFKDTICRDCPHGRYSNTEGGVCKPWTDCLAKGLQVIKNGSRSEDKTCGAPLTIRTFPTRSARPPHTTPNQPDKTPIEDEATNEGIAGIVAIILLLCIFIPFTLYLAVQRIKKQKQLPLDVVNNEDLPVALVTAADDRCSCHCPEEEMGDWQLRQETTPKPPE